MESIQVNFGKLEAQLVSKAEEGGEAAKDDSRTRIDALESRHQAAQAKLDGLELEAAGAEKWDTFKLGIESAWHEIETAFKKLKN
jgi:hypothetical protein